MKYSNVKVYSAMNVSALGHIPLMSFMHIFYSQVETSMVNGIRNCTVDLLCILFYFYLLFLIKQILFYLLNIAVVSLR